MKLPALTLIAAAALAPAIAQADMDASEWISAELIHNEEYDDFVAAPILSDDPFQERLVWSDRYGDFVPPAFFLKPCPAAVGIAARSPVADL